MEFDDLEDPQNTVAPNVTPQHQLGKFSGSRASYLGTPPQNVIFLPCILLPP